MKHNKLVRDRIPEIIAKYGERPVTRILDDARYKQELKRKLHEEVNEFDQSGSAKELTDILEVVYALAASDGVNQEQLETMRRGKRKERGGFGRRIFLVETIPVEKDGKTEDE